MPINFEPVDMTDDDDQTEVKPPRATDRDEDQIQIDGFVAELATSWQAAGKPKQESAPWRKLIVSKTDVSATKNMIRRACTLAKVSPLYWKDATRPDGRISVKFTVTDPPPRKEKKNAANGAATAPAAPAAPAATAPKPGPAGKK